MPSGAGLHGAMAASRQFEWMVGHPGGGEDRCLGCGNVDPPPLFPPFGVGWVGKPVLDVSGLRAEVRGIRISGVVFQVTVASRSFLEDLCFQTPEQGSGLMFQWSESKDKESALADGLFIVSILPDTPFGWCTCVAQGVARVWGVSA